MLYSRIGCTKPTGDRPQKNQAVRGVWSYMEVSKNNVVLAIMSVSFTKNHSGFRFGVLALGIVTHKNSPVSL